MCKSPAGFLLQLMHYTALHMCYPVCVCDYLFLLGNPMQGCLPGFILGHLYLGTVLDSTALFFQLSSVFLSHIT